MIFATHKEMTEKDFQNAVVAYAKEKGWLVYHTYDSRRSQAGFPDLVMVKGKRVMFIELKSSEGKETEAQSKWLSALEKVEIRVVDVWRPGCQDGEIIRLIG